MILQLDPCKTNSWNLKITPEMKSRKSSSKPSTTKPWLWVLKMLVFGSVLPWKLTWNLLITPSKRKIIFQTSMIMFHVNFPGVYLEQQPPRSSKMPIRVKVLLPPPLLRPKMLRPRWMISTRRWSGEAWSSTAAKRAPVGGGEVSWFPGGFPPKKKLYLPWK